jgi:hypothetical protein
MTDARFKSIMAIIINATIFMMIVEATNLAFAITAVLTLCAAFVLMV